MIEKSAIDFVDFRDTDDFSTMVFYEHQEYLT